MEQFDFSGWATRSNLKCSDGRTIMVDAFREDDGKTVPLVWNHQHNDPVNVLGHALLKSRDGDIYTYCKFNDSESGKNAKVLVDNGDVTGLSIYANKLKQNNGNVVHGCIREVSLVLAGANPGAYIDTILSHSDVDEEEAIAWFIKEGEDNISIFHAEETTEEIKMENVEPEKVEDPTAEIGHGEKKDDKTVKDVFDSLTEEQKNVVYAMIGMALEEKTKEKKGNENMKQNVFENDSQNPEEVLSHSEMCAIIADGKKCGSIKEAFLEHGITNVDYLFPDAKNYTKEPILVTRKMGWVAKVMDGVHRSPFSRVKSTFANLTEEDARAKGYIKGNLKKDEVFGLLKRVTTPTTVYKKQKMDRDDVVDITDLDVIAFLKKEMRMMLDEEIARAILVGDGRLSSSDDKINAQNIRPILGDDSFFTIPKTVSVSSSATDDDKAKALIKAIIKARKDYRGSGNPTFYTTEDVLTNMLLLTDTTGRDLYDDETKLVRKLRVKEIVTVPVMENLTGSNSGSIAGILVNLEDYNVGADKGGAINMFDDFDIDYNAMKYLIETRCSGALTVPYSAVSFEIVTAQ